MWPRKLFHGSKSDSGDSPPILPDLYPTASRQAQCSHFVAAFSIIMSEHHKQHTDSSKSLSNFVLVILWHIPSNVHQLFKIYFPKDIFTNVKDILQVYRHYSLFPNACLLQTKQSVAMQRQWLGWLISLYLHHKNNSETWKKKIQSNGPLHRKIIHQSLPDWMKLLHSEDITNLYHPSRYARGTSEIYFHLALALCSLYFVSSLLNS